MVVVQTKDVKSTKREIGNRKPPTIVVILKSLHINEYKINNNSITLLGLL